LRKRRRKERNKIPKTILIIRMVHIKGKVKSGIKGLDKLIGGGFTPGSVNLIAGKTGSGKTLTALQMLYKGAKDFDEPGLYITTEQPAEDLREDALKSFGWDIRTLEAKGMFKFMELHPYKIKTLPKLLTKMLQNTKYKRVVIDSESMFGLFLQNPFEERVIMFNILRKFKDKDITVFLTTEILEDSKGLSRFGVIEFLADSIILLNFLMFASKYNRALAVRKMRRTKHDEYLHPVIFTPDGIIIKESLDED